MSTPAALDAAAAELAGQAAVLPGLLDRAVARSGVDVWQGPAQQDLAGELARLRGALRGAAGELSALAVRLRAEAASIRAEEARLAAAAEAAERAAARRAAAGTGGRAA
jgi:septal ring factor EnvC (AmiA/AmiB activator)